MKTAIAIATVLGIAMGVNSSLAQQPSQNIGTMATGAPAVLAGPMTGPWTNPNPGLSHSQCQPGEHAIGLEVEGAPGPTKYCIGCIMRLRVICQHLP